MAYWDVDGSFGLVLLKFIWLFALGLGFLHLYRHRASTQQKPSRDERTRTAAAPTSTADVGVGDESAQPPDGKSCGAVGCCQERSEHAATESRISCGRASDSAGCCKVGGMRN